MIDAQLGIDIGYSIDNAMISSFVGIVIEALSIGVFISGLMREIQFRDKEGKKR